jgi:hypothetical protein
MRCDLYFTDNENGSFAFAVLKRCRKKGKAKFVAALIHAFFERKGIETIEDLEQMDDREFEKLIEQTIVYGPQQDKTEEMLGIIRMLVSQKAKDKLTKEMATALPEEKTDKAEERNMAEALPIPKEPPHSKEPDKESSEESTEKAEVIPEENNDSDDSFLSGFGDDLNMDLINAALSTMNQS